MAKYQPKIWEDKIKDAEGNVVQEGTPILARDLQNIETGIVNIDEKVDGFTQQLADTSNQLDTRIDNIIATPTTISEQEIIDARQGSLSLGSNISAIKKEFSDYVGSALVPNLGELANGIKDEVVVSREDDLSLIKRVSDTHRINDFLTSISGLQYHIAQPNSSFVFCRIDFNFSKYITNANANFLAKGGILKDKKVGYYTNKGNSLATELKNIGEMCVDGGGSRYLIFTIPKDEFGTKYSFDHVGVRQYCFDNELSIAYQLPQEIISSLDDKNSSALQIMRLTIEVQKLKDNTGLASFMTSENESWLI